MPGDPKVTIVYFCNINPMREWRKLIVPQLRDIWELRPRRSQIVMVISGKDGLPEEARSTILEDLPGVSVDVRLSPEFGEYEYPGVAHLRELALAGAAEDLYVYLHSKGMYSGAPGVSRTRQNERLTRALLHDSDATAARMMAPEITRSMTFPSYLGWAWFNFFWIKGGYLASCDPVERHPENRYYFESYIQTGDPSPSSCLCLLTGHVGKDIYWQHQVLDAVNGDGDLWPPLPLI